jgi:hypothetical protein
MFAEFEQDPTFNLIGRPRGPRMPCGWGCGADLPASDASALHHLCESAGGLRRSGPSEPEGQACVPTGFTNAVRLAPRCPNHGEPDASAFHSMPKAAGGLRPCGPKRGNAQAKRGHPPGADYAVRLGLATQLAAPNARALHNMREAAGGLRARGPAKEELWTAGRRTLYGWGCGSRLTASRMREH